MLATCKRDTALRLLADGKETLSTKRLQREVGDAPDKRASRALASRETPQPACAQPLLVRRRRRGSPFGSCSASGVFWPAFGSNGFNGCNEMDESTAEN
jgi:hypothetical protein